LDYDSMREMTYLEKVIDGRFMAYYTSWYILYF